VKLRLLVVGRGSRQLADFEARFIGRLQTLARCEVIELPEGRGKQVSQRRQEEAKHILKQVRTGFILFDEQGQLHNSMEWAGYLRGMRGDAQQDFVIMLLDYFGAEENLSLSRRGAPCAIRQSFSISPMRRPPFLARPSVG